MALQGRRAVLRALLALAAASSLPVVGAYTPPTKYLIVSNARNGTIGYVRVPPASSGMPAGDARILVAEGLGHPQGLAVDQKRRLLIVADSALRKVVSYGLSVLGDGSLAVDEQTPLAENIDSRWVAVDGPGNVYMSDEQSSRLMKVSARQVLDGDTTPQVASTAMSAISAPGGLATDNFHLYWVNKRNGAQVGSVVKGLEASLNTSAATRGSPEQVTVLAKNLPKAFGVCLAIDNIFFTSPSSNVFVVKTTGGDVATVTTKLRNPRGCAWDGDSTVYVADRTENGVYAFPGPMVSLGQATASKVVHFEDAFGVAVFSSATPRCRLAWRGLLLLAAAVAAAAGAAV